VSSSQSKSPNPAKDTSKDKEKAADTKKTNASLEEDDEFEDFPVEDWSDADTDAKAGGGKNALWEESWDDDDTSDDFSAQVREQLKKNP